MKLEELAFTKQRNRKRVGRGISAGGGKTAGRGTKGQNSRSGGQRNPGFEGGQNPLFQRIPKQKGFKSKRAKLAPLQSSELNKLKAGLVTHETLVNAGYIDKGQGVKLLFDEVIAKAYKIHIEAVSVTAMESLQKAGGSFEATKLKAIAKKADKDSK